MKNQSKLLVAGSKIISFLLLALLNFQIMAQTNYKTVKEAKDLQIGGSVADFSALDLHDITFTLSKALKKFFKKVMSYVSGFKILPTIEVKNNYIN